MQPAGRVVLQGIRSGDLPQSVMFPAHRAASCPGRTRPRSHIGESHRVLTNP